MTPADLTLPTPGANPLAVLPPRRRTGARVEPWISGVTAVERQKKDDGRAGLRYGEFGQNMDTRRARHAQSYPIRVRVYPVIALRTALIQPRIIRSTPPFERYPNGLGACAIEVREAERGCARSLAAISASARTLLWSRTERALSSLQRLAPLSCSGPTTRTLPFSCRGRTSACGVVQPMGGVALIPPPIAQCSLLLRWALPVPGVDAGFYKRMRSSLNKKTRTARSPPEFVFCRHWPAAGETQPGPPLGKQGWGSNKHLQQGGPQAPGPPLLAHKP
ncbi:hypothetical protein H6P81_021182 [Aristolochia fimbriata]|uniref:Uncharacterized protein n=1 Tax=Aristolochia fimbriata TaxID=158543 RepID=A0AAV7DRL6_ARIFI|nr:hypothetical protein H6P81_021182 [Aristolochia fimbriata]